MNLSIDSPYCNRFIHIGRQTFSVNRSGASFTIPTTFGNAHARWLHSRGTAHQICDPSRIIAIRQLNALTVPWSHNVSNDCIYIHSHLLVGTNSIAINLITEKDRFLLSIGHQRQSPNSFCQLVVIRWLRNDFSIPRVPENMSHENVHYNLYLHLDDI